MAGEPRSDELKTLWQQQPTEKMHMSIEELRVKASVFERRIRRRNSVEYLGATAVIGFSVLQLAKAHGTVVRVGSLLAILGVLYVVIQLYRRGSARLSPERFGISPALDFHRGELERQRDLLRGVWSWYLAPLLPGWVLMVLSGLTTPNGISRQTVSMTALNLVAGGALFWAIGRMNHKAANRIQAQIDALRAGGER